MEPFGTRLTPPPSSRRARMASGGYFESLPPGSVRSGPSSVRQASRLSAAPLGVGSVGVRLRHERELRAMSLEEVARATRVPIASLERIEADRFDELPGEVFVRGFLRSYAKALGIDGDEVVALYGTGRRVLLATPTPVVAANVPSESGRRVGIALAVVLFLVLCTMALSFVLKPRGRDLPPEISRHGNTLPVVTPLV